MIRVLQVVTYMGRGGLETMLMNYYRHIDREKIQFDFLVHRDFEADYDKEILNLGGKIYHMPKLVPWSKSYKSELGKFFDAHPEYKIIHVHQDCLSSVALQVAKEHGIPIRIAHSHSSSADKNIKYIIKKHYMKKIPKFATELFACGKQAGDWMFNGHEYRVINNAIDVKKYVKDEAVSARIRREFDLENEIIIGHVGRFSEPKNHPFLIDIFNELVKKDNRVRLFLVGVGDGMEEIKKKVEMLSIKEKVIFLGLRSDVNELMQAMDVFVFPSLWEGVPVTMIEAQASGLPCVISDHVSSECIVTSNLVTIMKLENSAEEWAEHILLRLKEERKNTTEEIKANRYDIDVAAKWLQDYYLNKSEG